MNWAWATSLDQFWRSPAFPMWLTLAAAAFFAIIVLVTLLRAEKSVANGALTVITLLAMGIAVTGTLRGFGPARSAASDATRPIQSTGAALPALFCIDDLAGEIVLAGCEKALFGSAESVAAAVSYAASQITRLTALSDLAATDARMASELQLLRHAVERDRYGLIAQVLLMRDHCTPADCAAFGALTDRRQIVANMDERLYDGLVLRYSPGWNAPAISGPVPALAPTMPTGKPTNAEFPSAASTPPVSIMTPEPGTATTSARPTASPPAANSAAPSPRLASGPGLVSTKKLPATKPPRPLAPPQATPAAPAAANE